MLENLLSVNAEGGGAPTGGQVVFDVAGTYEWEVPEGVNEIHTLIIQAGTSGSTSSSYWWYGGRGGSLRYKNNIPVTPGMVLTITIGSGGITVPRAAWGTGATGGGNSYVSINGDRSDFDGNATHIYSPARQSEFIGETPKYANTGIAGGSSALLPPHNYQTSYGIDLNTCDPVLYGTGCGGNVVMRTYVNTVYKGSDGGVKIIWGKNRAFPDLNVHNI